MTTSFKNYEIVFCGFFLIDGVELILECRILSFFDSRGGRY